MLTFRLTLFFGRFHKGKSYQNLINEVEFEPLRKLSQKVCKSLTETLSSDLFEDKYRQQSLRRQNT